MSVQLVKSPWLDDLRGLAGSADSRVTVVTPFVTAKGWSEFIGSLTSPHDIEVSVYTSLDAEAVAGGYLDLSVLAASCRTLPKINFRHIPRLHAKVYIADSSRAIVTSGNLTMSSLSRNNEYGVQISDQAFVATIERDVDEYAALGATISCESLQEIEILGSRLKETRSDPIEDEQKAAAIRDFDFRVRGLRGEQHRSTNAILLRTILYLLAKKPMRTQDMHPLIEGIHPDICNDDTDRVINGISFGRLWKHSVRNAQVTLQRQGKIVRAPRRYMAFKLIVESLGHEGIQVRLDQFRRSVLA